MSFFQRFCGVTALAVLPFATLAEESPTSVAGASAVSVEEAYALFEQEVAFVDVQKRLTLKAGISLKRCIWI